MIHILRPYTVIVLLFSVAKRFMKSLKKNKGFACSNVALGVGSFFMHCIEEDNILKPFTRATFSSCIKACYAEVDDKCYPEFKNPKEGRFKKVKRDFAMYMKKTAN